MSNGEYRVGLNDPTGRSNYLLEGFPAWSPCISILWGFLKMTCSFKIRVTSVPHLQGIPYA